MIADVYDALTSRRVYKDPYTHEVSVEKIRQGSGQHFDPLLVEVFLSIEAQFEQIAISMRAPDESRIESEAATVDRSAQLIPEVAGDLIESLTGVGNARSDTLNKAHAL